MADGWLSTVLGIHRIKNAANTIFAQRSTLKFVGAAVADDPTNKQTVVTVGAAGQAETLVVPQLFAYPGNNSEWIIDLTFTGATNRIRWVADIAGDLLYPLRGTVPNGATITACKCKVVPAAAAAMNVALIRYDANFAVPGTLPAAGTVIGNQNSLATTAVQVTTLSGLSTVVDYSTYEYFVRLKAATAADLAYGCAVSFTNP
ncbi:MAG TPA: hypothetical protein VK509_10055 [Polyangiales bacterium]|nr:hypothetical protein [Polyangiales bacterium]